MVPYATLHRYLKGQHLNEGAQGQRGRPPKAGTRPRRRQSPRPKDVFLWRVAHFYGTTLDGLYGEPGDPLSYREPYVVRRSWRASVEALALPPEVAQALLDLPLTMTCAHETLCHWGLGVLGIAPPLIVGDLPDLTALWRAQEWEAKAWTTLLEGLVASFGRERVREKLISELDRIRLGFQPFALTWFGKTVAVPEDLPGLYEPFRPITPPGAQHVGRVTYFVELPALPPLRAEVSHDTC